MRIVRGSAQHLVDALDEPLGHDMFELFCLVVDLGPAHAHHLHQKQLHKTMTPQHKTGELRSCGR